MRDLAPDPSCVQKNKMMSSTESREEVLNAGVTIQLDVDELSKPKPSKKQIKKALRAKREQKKREEEEQIKEEQIKEEVDRLRHAGCLYEGHRVSGCSFG